MRVVLIMLALLSLSQLGCAQLEEHQQLFFNAKDVSGIQEFYNWAAKDKKSNALKKAYAGLATAMYAELCDGVKQKLDHFSKGKDTIEESIKEDPDNSEIRFLRFSMQCETPWFLGYTSNKEEDADVIILALKQNKIKAESAFWKKALAYMKNSGELTSSQSQAISKWIR